MYKHIAVRDLIPLQPSERESIAIMAAKGWGYWLDGLPVTVALHRYGNALREVSPLLRFRAPQQRAPLCTDDPLSGVLVCLDTCPYVLLDIAAIGKYTVRARNITNNMHRPESWGHHVKASVRLVMAVKNALKYLSPYSTLEIALLEGPALIKKSKAASASKSFMLTELVAGVNSNALLNEVRALKAAGVLFNTPEFKCLADNMDEAMQLSKSEHMKRVDAVLVRFIERAGGVVVECVEMQNIRNKSDSIWLSSVSGPFMDESRRLVNARMKGHEIPLPTVTHDMSKVPQYIVEKVAVLRTLDDGGHVDGVGMKVEEGVFWVEK